MSFKTFFAKVNHLIQIRDYHQALELIDINIDTLSGFEKVLAESSRSIAEKRLHLSNRFNQPYSNTVDSHDDADINLCVSQWPVDFFHNHNNNSFLNETLSGLEGKIICGIASQSKRQQSLLQTISSLSPQFDRVFVYLNDYEEIPTYFSMFENVHGLLGSMLFGDIGDVGKFAFMKAALEFYFTCDDDLVYPNDYVIRSLASLECFNHQAAVSWHGSILNEKFENYYSSGSRKVFSFGAKHPDLYIPLAVAGTGCLSFHIKLLPHLHLGEFKSPNMADIYFARHCKNNQVGLVLVPHDNGEIKEQEECVSDSIYKHSSSETASSKDNSKLINSLILQQRWNPASPRVKKVCLIGRFNTNPKGGIYKSCRAISNCLASHGINVTEVCTSSQISEKNVDIDSNDVIIAYLPHPHRPDYGKWLNICLQSKRPIIANLSYDLTAESLRVLRDAVDKSKEMNNNLYIMCFSNTICGYLGSILGDPAVKRVVFPKTLLVDSKEKYLPEYEQREGILFGDFAKMANRKLVGSSYERWIAPLRKCLPFVSLYALKHYGTSEKIPSFINLVDYNQNGINHELLKFRLYICLTPYATFEMVPIEAAAQGVPVLSRFMPQSASEYLAQSLVQFDTPEQLAYNAERIYNNEIIWNKISLSTRYAARSASLDLLDHKLIAAIESVCFGLV